MTIDEQEYNDEALGITSRLEPAETNDVEGEDEPTAAVPF